MISKFIQTAKHGFKVMQLHPQLFLVAILIFVLPLAFLYSSQKVFTTAEQNIETAQKERVGILHDTLSAVLKSGLPPATLDDLLNTIASNNPDIEEVSISRGMSSEYLTLHSLKPNKVGATSTGNFLYDRVGDDEQSLLFPSYESGHREWYVIRKIQVAEEPLYIVSVHNFASIDAAIAKREQYTYLVLTLVFGFLLSLAYWMARQIHWRKETEKLREELEERNLFTNMIAHEFRAPLTAINGYSSFLAESDQIKNDEAKYVENIQISAGRLLALVNDFLEVARIQSGKLNLNEKNIEVESVLYNVVESLKSSAIEKRLELVYEKPLKPLHIFTDENRLTQILTNIVSNSIKYTDKGKVTIVADNNPVALIIRIKDTGMGISAGDQKKLFAPFMRVGGVEKTKTVGTGLGMWITKQLVSVLGGTIGVESIKGVGTHVVLTFKHRKIAR